MTTSEPRSTSWWVGKSRDELRAAIAQREAEWHAQKPSYLDHIGQLIVGHLKNGGPRPKHD